MFLNNNKLELKKVYVCCITHGKCFPGIHTYKHATRMYMYLCCTRRDGGGDENGTHAVQEPHIISMSGNCEVFPRRHPIPSSFMPNTRQPANPTSGQMLMMLVDAKML